MPEYMKLKFDTHKMGLKESVIRLYPFVCMHYGAAQSDVEFIRQQIQRCAKDPNGYALYLGDAGECCTKISKGDIYAQLLSPQQQADMTVEEFAPLSKKNKLLFGIRGNHGNRIAKETGLDFDKNLCHRLGVPYLGVSAFVNLTVNRSSYDCYFNHGADSGTPLQTKIAKAEHFGKFIDADAIFTAHSHVCMELQPSLIYSADNANCNVRTKLRSQYICGSGYDSRTGYADDKAYQPILPSYIIVTFSGVIVEGHARYKQTSEIIRSDGQHALKHDYLGAYK